MCLSSPGVPAGKPENNIKGESIKINVSSLVYRRLNALVVGRGGMGHSYIYMLNGYVLV